MNVQIKDHRNDVIAVQMTQIEVAGEAIEQLVKAAEVLMKSKDVMKETAGWAELQTAVKNAKTKTGVCWNPWEDEG